MKRGFGLAGRYPERMNAARSNEPGEFAGPPGRESQEVEGAVLESRRRPMAERLELALSWNLVASELRAGMTEAQKSPTSAK